MYQRLEFNSLIPRQSGGCIIHTVKKKGYQLMSDQPRPTSGCILQDNLLTLFGDCNCSKILNTCCQPKWPNQTAQTQIRLLMKKLSDQGLPTSIF